jgi:hypothetical protein
VAAAAGLLTAGGLGVCLALDCDRTPAPVKEPAPSAGVPDTSPPSPTRVKEEVGQRVFRVYDSVRSRAFGNSWTPDDPELYGPQKYRVPAGLPDKRTTGNCLITGKLLTTAGVEPKLNGADPVWPPASYRYYPGGLDEFVITNSELVVVDTTITQLFPPYGDDPDHPPTHVAPC